MASGVQSWSQTAANNATADANVNWAEGMAPSAVNDSARAEMASVAKFRDDTNGSIATGGSSTAYTVTSNQSFASLSAMGNAVIAFVPHTTSGDAPTLAVDGLTAKKIRFETGIDLPTGSLIQGTPYVVTYYASVGEFILHNMTNPYNVPIAGGLDYWGTTAPNSAFALAYGQAISRTTYSVLFGLLSTTFGVGDGTTTFNIPDLRGRVTAGKDDMGGTSANRLTDQTGGLNGDTLGATGGSETHTLTEAQLASHTHTFTANSHDHNFTYATITTDTGSGGGTTYRLAGAGASNQNTSAATVTGSNASAGSGSAHNNVQPTIICNKLIRVL